MALPEEFLDRLKQSNDIVSAMSNYAELKRAGRDFVCLCPFHSEKSPSCHIYTDDAHFYCFGCGTGGDVITFTMLTQNLEYMAAVQLLAERSGIPMPDDGRGEEAAAELRKRAGIYEMNKAAAKFFRDCLLGEGGRACLTFLRERGLTDNTIRKYGIGYAPRGGEFKAHMNALGFRDYDMVQASLLKRRLDENSGRESFSSTFWERAMFPIIDRTGKVVAFSGRRIDGGKDYKYVNSSETPVYKKGENLFSINFAKNAKNSKPDCIILCEGNIDAVMLNQAGFDNTVAILGTALTPQQARLLRHYCSDVVIAYDSDAAGEKATVKAINLLNREGMSARVLQLGDAKDPDEYIQRFGAESFALLLEKSGSAINFELDKLRRSVNLDTPEGKTEYLAKSVELLSGIEDDNSRLIYAGEIAGACNITSAGVLDSVNKKRRSKEYGRQRDERRELLRPAVKRDAVNPESGDFPAQEKAEQVIIAFLFHSQDKLATILRSLSPMDFPTAFNRKLFETLILRLNKRASISTASLGGEFSAAEVGRIEKIKKDSKKEAFTDIRLTNAINILLEHKKSQSRKPYEEMTNEEGMDYLEEIKNKHAAKV